jgi:hypothetical protein
MLQDEKEAVVMLYCGVNVAVDEVHVMGPEDGCGERRVVGARGELFAEVLVCLLAVVVEAEHGFTLASVYYNC